MRNRGFVNAKDFDMHRPEDPHGKSGIAAHVSSCPKLFLFLLFLLFLLCLLPETKKLSALKYRNLGLYVTIFVWTSIARIKQ